jgi:hypothetical protein
MRNIKIDDVMVGVTCDLRRRKSPSFAYASPTRRADSRVRAGTRSGSVMAIMLV